MFQTLGFQELLLILVIVLFIFGPKKLPALGESLGRGIRNFKNGISGKDRDIAEEEAASLSQLPPGK
jgi:sec-independent protein translocase protein TatA